MTNHIQRYRHQLRLSRLALAKSIAVDTVTIWRWETGKTVPCLADIVRLAEAMQTTPQALFPALAPATAPEEPAHVV